MLKIALYELKKMLRDHRWLAIFMIQPIMIIILLGLVANHDPKNMAVSVYSASSNAYSDQILADIKKTNDLKVELVNSEEAARHKVANNEKSVGVIINISTESGLASGKLSLLKM